jgi:Sulfite oxidase and related enzymes
MNERFVSRGFRGRRQSAEVASRIPPGQYLERGFPVLSAGPTPHIPLDRWDFSITGEVKEPKHWSWEELLALPHETPKVDIHCVTKWTKLDTHWEGISVDHLLQQVTYDPQQVKYVLAFCDGGYTTNYPLADIMGGKAWIVFRYDDAPLSPEHGGPARMLIPHLYFWKSAKWVRGLQLLTRDQPGFWESFGYHNYGDPWKEERYWND